VEFLVKEFSVFNRPSWFLDGVAIAKELAKLPLKARYSTRKMKLARPCPPQNHPKG
jgi:V/A-type H+/Na+-transporting ATPase subunit D